MALAGPLGAGLDAAGLVVPHVQAPASRAGEEGSQAARGSHGQGTVQVTWSVSPSWLMWKPTCVRVWPSGTTKASHCV